MKKTALLVLLPLVFAACSSKYQANDLPLDRKTRLVENGEPTRYYLDLNERKEFEKYVAEQFETRYDEKKIEKMLVLPKQTENAGVVNVINVPAQSEDEPEEVIDLWSSGYQMDKQRY